MKEEPALRTDGLRGGLKYYDAVTNDARLALTVILAAVSDGAAAVNYVKAHSWEHAGGRVAALNCHDVATGAGLTVRGRVFVSAAGSWTDDVRAMGGESSMLRPTKGVHVVVLRERLPVQSIVAFEWQGRNLFVVPAGQHSYIGTTDTDWQGDPKSAEADASDVSYLIEAANAYFEGSLTSDDVTAAWAGVRPLVADEGSPTPSDVSRDFEIVGGPPGVYTICGGKLTTGRAMAEALIDQVVEVEGHRFEAASSRCRTSSELLPGAVRGFEGYRRRVVEGLGSGWGIPEESAGRLVDKYGSDHVRVLGAARHDPALMEPVIEGMPDLLAEAAHAAEHEMVLTLEDFMRRRSDLMLFGPRDAGAAMARVADVLAAALHWDDAEKRRQIASYEGSVARMLAFRSGVAEAAAPPL